MNNEILKAALPFLVKTLAIVIPAVILKEYLIEEFQEYKSIITGFIVFFALSLLQTLSKSDIQKLQGIQLAKVQEKEERVLNIDPSKDITAANIKKYKEQLALQKLNKKWWQFWL